jgi:hypothetical protein
VPIANAATASQNTLIAASISSIFIELLFKGIPMSIGSMIIEHCDQRSPLL